MSRCACVRGGDCDPFFLLRHLATRCIGKEAELSAMRESRDREALELVDAGHTWREIADAAGFKNPYIAHLKKRAKGAS